MKAGVSERLGEGLKRKKQAKAVNAIQRLEKMRPKQRWQPRSIAKKHSQEAYAMTVPIPRGTEELSF